MQCPAGYAIAETLHEGRASLVCRGVRASDGRRVVLKALGSRWGPRDLRRLEHEYELGRRLALPAVLKPLALESHQGTPVLVLEDFEGGSLAHLGVRLDLGRVLHIASQLASALAALHAEGVVHGDVKPANVLVRPGTDEVRLIDLGLASAPEERQAPQADRRIEGSLPYLSPEQTGRTEWPVDARSDLYSLGVTLYELCAGRLPFQADDPPGWIHCHLARDPPPLSEVAPGTPAVLSEIVAKLLAKSPQDRYQCALGLRADLERCLASLACDGRIEPFPLAQRDVPDRFQVPSALHGREEEVAAIRVAFERVVASGSSELLLVSGYAGVGKTSVIRAAQEPLARRGFFLSGKFDQRRRDVPYSGLTEAFGGLLRALLAEGEEHVAEWRGRLAGALGKGGRALVPLLPELELLLGPQPPVHELPPAETRNRMHLVFRRFLGALAREERPLTLFLDDLQWADQASLELLADVLTHPGTRRLLAIGAYRDNEVHPSHPLAAALAGLRKAGLAVHEVALGPLPWEHLGRLVAGAMLRTPREVEPLTHLLQEKTAGNPFFAIQLLTSLCEEGLITLDPEELAWRCDIDSARARGYSENVVDLMVGRLRRLPLAAQEVARLAACLGSAPDVGTLALLRERSREETHRDLGELVREGLLARADDAYAFSHDRVQQAAYALIPEERRPEVHLRIGRMLYAHTPADLLGERAFEIVNHLNRGLDLITDPREREALGQLEVLAGRKARASSAYAAARTCFEAAAAFLPPDAWSARHDETFALHLELAECEYLAGDLRRAEEILDDLLRRARSDLDRARVHDLRMELYKGTGRFEEAWRTALQALALFGVSFPDTRQECAVALEAENREIRLHLGARRPTDLAEAPEMTSPELAMVVRLLVRVAVSAYNARPDHHPLVISRAVSLSVQHGNTRDSSLVYCAYPMVLIALGDIAGASEFYEAARRLAERRGDAGDRAYAAGTLGVLVNHWRNPISTSVPLLNQSIRDTLDAGDPVYAGVIAVIATWTAVVETGQPLDEALKASEQYAAVVEETRNPVFRDAIRLIRQLVPALEGTTREPASLDGEAFSEAACVAAFRQAGFGAGLALHRILKQVTAYVYGRYAEALAAGEEQAAAPAPASAFLYDLTHHFYRALTLAALHARATAEQQREYARTLHEELRRHALWAENGPNFRDRHALLAAEVARVEGRELEAQRLYEEAIRSARESGFVQNEAIASEIAARFYEQRGIETVAHAYLQQARSCYARWGALGKVSELDRRHPRLFGPRPSDPLATYSVRPEQLDLLSMAKASQAISRELVLPDLVRTLVQTVVEHGGARKGALVLARAGELRLEARAWLGPRGIEVELLSSPLGECQQIVPCSAIQLAARTRTRVVLGAEGAEPGGAFASDEYLSRARPRSALCLPVLAHGEAAGVLYLENDLIAGAFTPGRLTALELLAAQAAISLENTSLVERERAARAAAEEAKNRSALLAEAGALLSQSLDYEETLARVARLCIRSICDWCVIDVLEGEELRSVGGANVDPAKEPLLREMQLRYPTHRISRRASATVLRTGEPFLNPEVTEEDLARWCEDEEHARLVRELGVRCALAVPLVARGQRIGALSLVSCAPGRRYGSADLELAQELASRAAMAIDNARLYGEARSLSEAERRRAEAEAANRALQEQAVVLEAGKRAREEVLAVVSHDLRSPLSAILMSAGALEQLNPEGPQAEMARVISRSARRTIRLANDLLDFSAIEAGRLSMARAPHEAASIAREVVEAFQPAAASQGVRLIADLAPDAPVVECDRDRVVQVLLNLLANAVHVSAQGHCVTVSVAERTGQALFSVADQGPGIPPEEQPGLFDRYSRGRSASYKGAGLGLAIARKLVELHGGRIWVESAPGRGSAFRFQLPATSDWSGAAASPVLSSS